jgi:tripartite-type tricarboxylate transporter receptor subunit TctC
MRWFSTLVLTSLVSLYAHAQPFPNRPVRIIIPFPGGGGADVVMRALQPKLSEYLGQPVIIDNRAGAGGNLGTEAVARAPADGYTLLVATASQAINTTLSKNVKWDLTRDFVPVSFMVLNQTLLAINPSLPATNVRELITLAKAKPGTITYASYGVGSSAHMNAELFQIMTDVQMLHVPYKGAAPAITDLIGGQVNIIFADVAAILPYTRSGMARPLGMGSSVRFAGLPDVPTVAETVPGFETGGFLALLAPVGTPREAINAVNAAMVKTLASPGMQERLESLGTIPMHATQEELGQFLRKEIDKWAGVIKTANIKAE